MAEMVSEISLGHAMLRTLFLGFSMLAAAAMAVMAEWLVDDWKRQKRMKHEARKIWMQWLGFLK